MTRYDCVRCQSAGSVNRWGCCEICGEDFKDYEISNKWTADISESIEAELAKMSDKQINVAWETEKSVVTVEQDAA